MLTDPSVTKRKPANSKRPGLPKVKTGCLTCKTRRIKCDERRPACKRCTSTGRVCDGYGAKTMASSCSSKPSSKPLPGPKLLLPRRDHDEARSYHFFLEVAAPSLASLFDFNFWLGDIPRICHADPAIWHAVVGLGAAYELYVGALDTSTATARLKRLVLMQSSKSIQSLTNHSPRHHDKSRALAASILFTCMSSIQWRHTEARMHLNSARKILMELSFDLMQTSRPTGRFSPTTAAMSGDTMPSLPISITTADAIIAYLEIQNSAMEHGGLIKSSGILGATDIFNNWRYYQCPSGTALMESSTETWSLHLIRANQAAESLINSIIYHTQLNYHLIRRVKEDSDPEAHELLAASEKPFQVTFRELARIFRYYGKASALQRGQEGKNPPLHFLALTLHLIVIRLLLQEDPYMMDPALREKERPSQFAAILDIAERILRYKDGGRGAPKPKPLVLGPLSMVAHGGSLQSLRRRAISLMREFPMRDGLGDSLMQASVFETLLEREQMLLKRDPDGQTGPLGKMLEDESEDLEVPSLFRSFNSTVSFVGERSALVTSKTWQEAFQNDPVETRCIHW